MNLLLALLQADPTTSLVTRVGDQLFTIVLLVTITWLLWQRISKLQEKMDNYLEVDRKEMLTVIGNNNDLVKDNNDVMKEVLAELKSRP